MSLFNYIEHGARLSAGFWPVTADELSRMQVNAAAPGKGMRFESYGPHVFKSDVSGSASNRFKVPTHVGTQAGYANMSLLGKAATWSTPIVGLGASTYFVASGFSIRRLRILLKVLAPNSGSYASSARVSIVCLST